METKDINRKLCLSPFPSASRENDTKPKMLGRCFPVLHRSHEQVRRGSDNSSIFPRNSASPVIPRVPATHSITSNALTANLPLNRLRSACLPSSCTAPTQFCNSAVCILPSRPITAIFISVSYSDTEEPSRTLPARRHLIISLSSTWTARVNWTEKKCRRK